MPRNTAVDYRHRPAPLSFANRVGRHLGVNRRIRLAPEELIAAAVRVAGSEDFGPGGWSEGLVRLCRALDDEAQLNLVGRLSARQHLQQLLVNRLQIESARRADPQIAAQTIARPVFITGLPRTGSTLLHGMMGADPALRVPWTWEVMLPGPQPPGADEQSDRQRIARTSSMLRWVDRLAPRFQAIHPIGAKLPQECIAITAHQFASVEFHTTFNVPSYQHWLDRDAAGAHGPALLYHRRVAQHLQRFGAVRDWVFKAPAHLYGLPAILEAYPDARFVFTTRDPEQVVASIASHGVVLRSAFSDRVNVEQVADKWMHWWAEGWRRALAFRAQHPQRFVDLAYDDLVNDPIAAVASVYDGLGLQFSDDTAQRMRRFLANNRQDKHGRHRYSAGDFGLDAATIRALFPPVSQ